METLTIFAMCVENLLQKQTRAKDSKKILLVSVKILKEHTKNSTKETSLQKGGHRIQCVWYVIKMSSNTKTDASDIFAMMYL